MHFLEKPTGCALELDKKLVAEAGAYIDAQDAEMIKKKSLNIGPKMVGISVLLQGYSVNF